MDNQNQPQDSFLQPKRSFLKRFSNIPAKHIIIFLVVLFFLSSGSTGYLLFANKKKLPSPKAVQEKTAALLSPAPKKIVPSSTIAPTPTLAHPASPTATWSAYVSAKYNYSLKYPPDWTAKITTQADPKILEYAVFNPKTATKAGTLTITLSYSTRTYQEALALDPQIGETVTVASVGATKKNQLDSDGNKSINITIPVGATNTIIINAKEKYKSILDLMLTAVKLK